ncbi:MAG: hypothetical protein U0175_10840 [Caldilineaceae bacterium]
MNLEKPFDLYESSREEWGLWQALLADGRPLLVLTGLALVLVGGFAIFLGVSEQFLPHDVQFLGMDAAQLCRYHECHIVHFMIHDRIAFGGALVALGVLYLWLVEFPLRAGQSWAWWAILFSGTSGFLSFLSWLRYGYLDTWHGTATLFLLPCFVIGLWRSYYSIHPANLWMTFQCAGTLRFDARLVALLLTTFGLTCAGIVIMVGGATRVFVPQDLHFMQLSVADLNRISPRLVPLIAHDRASFGGAILSTGIAMFFCVWFGKMSRSLWQALLLAGSAGFGCAIGTHFEVGYVDWSHLAPALLGVSVFYFGLLCYRFGSAVPPSPRQ